MNPTNYASYTLMPFLICFVHAIIISTFVTVSESSYSTSYEDHHFMRRVDNYRYNTLSSAAPSRPPLTAMSGSRVYHVVAYGADPTGESDSTEAIEKAISDAFEYPTDGHLMKGILDLGGSQLHLDGGTYKISRPLRLPDTSAGNFMIHGGSLRASESFPSNGHLIELRPSSPSVMYEYITLKDLMLNCNFRGGGIAIINSLRTTVDNCYVSHFRSEGIVIEGGHESYIRNSFIGQHINVGGDRGEKDFSGIGVKIMGNDNLLRDIVIYSAEIGVMVLGQANVIMGVHCYNKARALGGVGIYVKEPGFTQTRIVNCYLDYTGVVAEDPVQVHITGCFFLGNALVVLKSIGGVISGLNIVDNMFSGDYTGVRIVELDESKTPFTRIDQVVVDRNNVRGMVVKSTVGRGSTRANGTTWTVDFSSLLLFPNLIKNVVYSLEMEQSEGQGQIQVLPNHVLTNLTHNRVTVRSNLAIAATLHVQVHQTTYAL
ncbi:polygalacturonase QRT3-like [Cucumis melo var. makuwa]|uniref:Polygalacturonase QRT3-like n=1 Tax=Cucumis melo var. makuwa TaxID=1194695 RepID=A0A5D3BRF5_CUCMM|nr:polygalacturonase QRT3-like [Cucumis melo var. makuwa]TYK00836.1 polygalacturonase QRT3-like [Cucumis melo var. makuwa]